MLRLLTMFCFSVLLVGAAGCGGGSDEPVSVTPDGAPYSYDVPEGFEVAEPEFPGEAPKFLTTVIPSGSDREGGLAAYEWTLNAKVRAYSTPELLDWLDRQTQAFYRGEGATLSKGMVTKVAGHDAVCWQIEGFRNMYEGVIDSDSCAIVGEENVVSQSCSWKPSTRAEVQRGCAVLRRSLEIF